MTYPCPGHKDGTKCKFCKKEEGYAKKVGDLTEIDSITREPIVDPCCKACAQNMEYVKKFPKDIAARFRSSIPKSDEL